MRSFFDGVTPYRQLRLTLPLALALASAHAAAQSEAHSNPPTAPAPTAPPGTPEPQENPQSAPAAEPSAPAPAGEPAAEASGTNPDIAEEQTKATVNELGEVVVSARRRTESAQTVPIAVAVLGGAALEAKGAVNLDSFSKEVPSITTFSGNARNTTVNIRGLGTGTAASGSGLDSGVGFYVDDVYFGRLSQAILNLIDIDRIEVLRGPQGTLFGRNTTAGAISVVTRTPSFSPDAVFDLSVGNYNYLQARGSLSGPIVDEKLAARVSFEAQTRNGFLINTEQLGRSHGQESFTVRGQVLYQPSEKTKYRLIADFTKLGQTCCRNTPIGEVTAWDNGTPLPYPWAARVAQFGYRPLLYDPGARKTDSNRQRVFRVALGGLALHANWDLGAATITSISAGRFWNTSPRNDGDQIALDVYREGNEDDRQRQFTQELRIASNGENAIDYVGGLYFLYQHLPTTGRTVFGLQAGEYLIPPGTQGLSPEQRAQTLEGAYARYQINTNTVSWAAFGQATWHILKSLDLTGGLRYTFERKFGNFVRERGTSVDGLELNEAQVALRNAYTPVVPYYEAAKNWHAVSGLATVSQKLGDDALAFFTYSRGSKSGGLNLTTLPRDANGNTRTDLAILEPETVDHFELGLKSQWFGRRFTANLSLFNTEIRDYQATLVDTTSEIWIWYLSNVGKVRSRGVEIELKATPTKGLTLYGAATYADPRYVNYKNAQCPWELRAPGEPILCDLSGQQLPVAPKLSASGGGTLTVGLSEHIDGIIGADFSYRSSYTSSTSNSRYSRVPGVGLVNARIGLKDPEGRWEALIWSQNLFDNLYFLQRGVDEQTGWYTGLLGDPRTYGVTLRYAFY